MENSNRLVTPEWFRVYSGAMYTGKTREFINEFDRIARTNTAYLAFKPTIDDRFPPTVIQSRGSKARLPCIAVPPESPESILDHLTPDIKAVGIDEMQFFHPKLHSVIEYLRDKGLYVVGTMLELDYRGEPFPYKDAPVGTAAVLLQYASDVNKIVGACTIRGCTKPGERTQRFTDGKPSSIDEDVVKIDHMGKSEQDDEGKKVIYTYKLRCRAHHVVPGKPKPYVIAFPGQ